MIKFTIPLKVNAEYGLNKVYAGVHWSKRKKQAEEIHELVYHSMMQQNVPPVLFKRPVRIDISYNSRMDCDNHGYLTKLIIDGMKGYLLKDDSKKYVKGVYQTYLEGKKIDYGVLVEVWEV